MSQTIENLYIFEGFSKEVVAFFLLMSQTQFHKAGEIIIKEGEKSNGCAYYINSWEVRVIQEGDEVAHIGPGGFFGEIALITDELRTATVEVTVDAELQVFLKDDFLTLMLQSGHSEEMKEEVRRRIIARVQK